MRSSTPATFTISEGKKLKKVPQGAVLSFLFEADMGEVIQNRQEVTIPIAPKLMEILQGALAWKTKEMDYVCPNIAARYNKNNAIGKHQYSGNPPLRAGTISVPLTEWRKTHPDVICCRKNKNI